VFKLKLINKKEAYLLPIYICLFFLPLVFVPYFEQSFTQGKEIFLKSILLLSFLILSVGILTKKRIEINNIFGIFLFAILFIAFCLFFLANSFSSTPVVALYGIHSRGFGMIMMLYIIIFGLYASLVLKKKFIQEGLRLLLFSGSIIALYSLFQTIGFDPLFANFDTDVFVGRAFAFLGNPGYLGQFFLILSVIGIYLVFSEKNIKFKFIYGSLSLVVLSGLLVTRTRAAMVALAFCLLLLAIKYFKKILKLILSCKKSIKILFASFVILLFASTIFLFANGNISGDIFSTRSLQSRMHIWKGAVQLIEKRPLLGYGQDTYYIYAPEVIDKDFLTLEEDINLSIDRIHNELLDFTFSFGMFAGFLYIIFFVYLLILFFRSKDLLLSFLALVLIGNIIQNQFGFPDITIALATSFVIGAILAIQSKKKILIKINWPITVKLLVVLLIVAVEGFLLIRTVISPSISEILYAKSKDSYGTSYEVAVNNHKTALAYMPYYSEPWYQLMILDPSSMPRALSYLEQIEGDSGNVLAWKGNLYANSDPKKASGYYMKALEKNPFYPNWIRSYADMLYKNGDLKNAYYLYSRYLEACPDYWKWGDTVYDRSPKEQKSYRIFFKNIPTFWDTVERTYLLEVMNKDALK